MKFIKHISFSYVLPLLIHSQVALAQNPETTLSPWSGMPLLAECRAAYQTGLKTYQIAIEKKVDDHLKFFSEEEKQIEEHCRGDFAVGLLDAQIFIQHTISVEYLLELDFAERRYAKNPTQLALLNSALKDLFFQKFKDAFIEPKSIDSIDLKSDESRKGLVTMTMRFIEQAREQQKPVQFGRFLFTQIGRPYTSFEYVVTPEGKLAEDTSGELIVEKGSYQLKAEMLIGAAVETAKAYLEYHPKMVIGEDSMIVASLDGILGGTPFRSTTRGQREMAPFELMQSITRMAGQMFLNLEPLIDIQNHMVEKQNAYLERDIRASKAFLTGVAVLPILPYAIKLSSWMLSAYGNRLTRLSINYVAGARVWRLNVGKFLFSHSTTLSVASSLLSVVAVRGYPAYTAILEYQKNPKSFTGLHLTDSIIVGVVSAVPIATIAPVFVSGVGIAVVQSGVFLTAETGNFLRQLAMGYQHGLKIGLKQSVVQLGTKAPIYLAKKWWGAWWVHGPTGVTLNTKLIADFAAYNAATILAEIVSRQFYEDPHRRFFTPDGINKVSVYNLLQKIPVSVIAGPIIKLNNFWARYAVWRTLDSVSSSLASATVDGGEVNWKLVKFEQNYGGSIGAATGEVERVMQMAIYNSAIPAKSSFFIGTTLKLAFLFPKSALKAYSLEIYLGHDTVSADDLIKRFRDDMGINLKNFSEEDILEGIEQFRADSEVKEFMNLRPVDAIASEQAK